MITDIKKLKSKLETKIKQSSNIFILGHNSPDFDSIGSCFGLYEIVKNLKKQAYIIVNDDETRIEPGVKKIIDDKKDTYNIIKKDDYLKLKNNNSLIIITDTNKTNLISINDTLDNLDNVIIIDHHMQDDNSIKTLNLYTNTQASSACEITSRLLDLFRVNYKSDIANYLLAGITLDTKDFTHNTTSDTHDVAEKLIKRGADVDYVNSLFLEDFESYCRISDIIKRCKIEKKYKEDTLSPITVLFSVNPYNPELIYSKVDYAKAAATIMNFKGFDASFVLGFIDDKTIHISARSNKKVNVGLIMEQMSGGGTAQSAGGLVESNDIFEVLDDLMSKVNYGISPEEEIIEKPQVVKIKK